MLIRFGVESLSGLLWNPYPLSRGIPVRIGVEYTYTVLNWAYGVLPVHEEGRA